MCYASYYQVLPEFYENYLNTKLARDEESVEMLDYLLDGRVVDIGYVDDVGGVYSGLVSQLQGGQSNLSSYFSKKMRLATNQLAKFMESFND